MYKKNTKILNLAYDTCWQYVKYRNKELYYLSIALKVPEYPSYLNFDQLVIEQMQPTVPHAERYMSGLSVH